MLKPILSILRRIWYIETLNYKRKGVINILIGYFLLYLYFWQLPILVKSLWPLQFENKLFFYLTIVQSIFFTGLFGLALIYFPGYMGVEIYKKYQINPELKKPWELQEWPQLRKRTIISLITNYLIISPLYLGLGMMSGRLRFQNFPTHAEIIKTFFILYLADDFLYMWAHRLLHHPHLYRFHKQHHEYNSVFCMMAQYSSPVEHIFGNLLPGTLIFSCLDAHVFSFFLWQFWKVYATTDGHSGYRFPWSPVRVMPFNYDSSYHEFHHSVNQGNFATSFYLFELFFGTNKLFLDRVFEKEGIKHDD